MSRAQMLPTEESYEARKTRLQDGARAKLKSLTPREIEVLHGVGKGESAAALGTRLGISVSTIWDHITAISGKVGVTAQNGQRCDALRTLALQAGLTNVWAG